MTAIRNAPSTGSGALARYLDEIGRYPLLSAAEEARLGRVMDRGRQARRESEVEPAPTDARQRELAQMVAEAERAATVLVTSNLRLVVSIAKRYESYGLPLADLVQEGSIGLMRAVAGFDHTRGFRFSTYAAWPIRRAILRGIANTARLVRLPVRAGELVARVQAAERSFEEAHGRRATVDELAHSLGMARERVREARAHAFAPWSLSAPIGEDGAQLGDMVADQAASPEEQAILSAELAGMASAMARLDERESDVLRLRFGLGGSQQLTLGEVGAHLLSSGDEARGIQRRAMAKLRGSMRSLRSSS